MSLYEPPAEPPPPGPPDVLAEPWPGGWHEHDPATSTPDPGTPYGPAGTDEPGEPGDLDVRTHAPHTDARDHAEAHEDDLGPVRDATREDDAAVPSTDEQDVPTDGVVEPTTPATREPWWRRWGGPAPVQVVTALQLVLAVAVAVVASGSLSVATKAALVLGLGALVVLAAWPVGDRRAVVTLVDLLGYTVRRTLARPGLGARGEAPALLPPLVVGRTAGPDGPEMGVVHDGAGWAAVGVVVPRHGLDGADTPSWLPETVEALGRDDVRWGAQVLLERDGHGVETLVAVRVVPGSSPAGGVLGSIEGIGPLLRHRLRVVDDALEPVGLTVRALDPAETVGQLTRAFALDDLATEVDPEDPPRDARLGEHRTCVVSPSGVEQVATVRSSATAPAAVACEVESLALRLPGRVTVAIDVEDGGWVGGAAMRVGVPPGSRASALAAATRRAMPPGADLLVPHWRQTPRYVATLPLGRRP